MLLQYFGFRQEPFGNTPDPGCLYLGATHREALASLEYGFSSNRGFTAMIAPPGMGKTTLLFRLLDKIRDSARSVFLFDIDPQCTPQEFVGYILRDIGITPAQSSYDVHEQLTNALVTENRAGRKFVVVIDEAQNLSDQVLERVRLLTNFETAQGKLMQIVFSGQPQLADKLMGDSLVQLRQRISTICRIEPLSPEETSCYIDFRLKRAGYDGERLFTTGAIKLIAEAGQGIPRTINNLCFNALTLCCALKRRHVDGSMVAEVIADLQLAPQSVAAVRAADNPAEKQLPEPNRQRPVSRPPKRWVLAATLPLIIALLCVIGFGGFRKLQLGEADNANYSDQTIPSLPVSALAAAGNSEANVIAPSQTTAPFAITVEPHQTLQSLSLHYLGSFDLQLLHQIQTLNPNLTDPDMIEVGQTLWLPGPPPTPSAIEAAVPANLRSLP